MAGNTNGMRGTRLGFTSYEVDSGLMAPRQLTEYICPDGHSFVMPFALEADEIPDSWECECGQKALRADLSKAAKQREQVPTKTPKTHFDQLMERRSKADLQELLQERVADLRMPKKAS